MGKLSDHLRHTILLQKMLELQAPDSMLAAQFKTILSQSVVTQEDYDRAWDHINQVRRLCKK